jgi:hypothetical protein
VLCQYAELFPNQGMKCGPTKNGRIRNEVGNSSSGWSAITIGVPGINPLTSKISSVVSLKLVEEQKQILRLTTPELKDVRGPVRSE